MDRPWETVWKWQRTTPAKTYSQASEWVAKPYAETLIL